MLLKIEKAAYDRGSRGSTLESGDRVVRSITFEGKHKLSYRWSKNKHIVT